MALIACKECNAQVSDAAAVCPHCGISLPSLTQNEKFRIVKLSLIARSARVGGGLFLFGFLGLAFIALSGMPKELFVSFLGIAKWMMGAGLLWYIAAEIERNLEMRRSKRKR
jgi:hypothetical protein